MDQIMIESLAAMRPLLLTGALGLAMFCGIVALGWPYLVRDPLKQRMRQAVGEGGRDRLRDKAVAGPGKKRLLLGNEPSKIMAARARRWARR